MGNILTQSQVKIKSDEMQYQCNILSKQLSKENFFALKDESKYLSDIDALANVYDGRILIIDSSYHIVEDTYELDEGKYHIGKEVLSCYKGETSNEFHADDQYIELTLPIYDSNSKTVEGVLLMTASTQTISDSIYIQNSIIYVIEFIVTLFIAVLAYIFSGFAVKPFKKLSKAINQASFGDMSAIEVKGNAEVEQITDSYNETLARLKHLDESRQEFVSNVSHELKTPITSIKVLADSLTSMGEAPVELYQEFLGDISHEIDRETRIIDDLLTIVRLEKKDNKIEPQPININEMLESILKGLKLIAKQRNIEVTLESFRPVIAEVDELKMSRALTNLIENSIKYNKDDGSVRVSLNADHNYFYVKIIDTGVGIPDDAKDKIFERFYRVDKARSRDTGGTGLGLAITKSIIQLHHGVIRVHSELGIGTTFHVRVPLNYLQ
ncbi:ATP-binding region, ATPase-like:Histidine kinase, HAMP region:Histidine kinase A-like protein [Lachnospiraceae bacterium TWA4]|nr:ATP-binding region, ATPase-like:Histidine kinase, HAMP region:Histidine kinase A-like protein [Lachnospiraceae bacterium TWA4]